MPDWIDMQAWRFQSDDISSSVRGIYTDHCTSLPRRPGRDRCTVLACPSHWNHASPPFAQESAIQPSELIVGNRESKFRNLEMSSGRLESILGIAESKFQNAESKNWRSESTWRPKESPFQSRVSPSSFSRTLGVMPSISRTSFPDITPD